MSIKRLLIGIVIIIVILYGIGISATVFYEEPKGAPAYIEWQGDGGTILGF